MVDKTLTAANSVYLLSVRGVYTTAQPLQGYSTDRAFETEAPTTAQVVKGVDGYMSAGFVPFTTKQTITLQADSPSIELFENWLAAMKQAREIIYADGTLNIPSVQRKYAMTKGVLLTPSPVPGAAKILEPRAFVIEWDTIDPAPGG